MSYPRLLVKYSHIFNFYRSFWSSTSRIMRLPAVTYASLRTGLSGEKTQLFVPPSLGCNLCANNFFTSRVAPKNHNDDAKSQVILTKFYKLVAVVKTP